MEKIYKEYLISIMIILLGSVMSLKCNYCIIVLLSIIIFSKSIKTNIMEKKEFILINFLLISVLSIGKIIDAKGMLKCIKESGKITSCCQVGTEIFYCSILLQLIGYIAAIVCLLRYNDIIS